MDITCVLDEAIVVCHYGACVSDVMPRGCSGAVPCMLCVARARTGCGYAEVSHMTQRPRESCVLGIHVINFIFYQLVAERMCVSSFYCCLNFVFMFQYALHGDSARLASAETAVESISWTILARKGRRKELREGSKMY